MPFECTVSKFNENEKQSKSKLKQFLKKLKQNSETCKMRMYWLVDAGTYLRDKMLRNKILL